ncbi:hypothetical protein [Ottowia thiooxydans]|uniref:Lipoprotein n=1 Tax=Ottowia thiooxydans TaxID=219182 RepID=A0ABV2QAY5_9BURK
MKFKLAALSLISVLMTACGGGGDDGPKTPEAPPAAASASPEGRWSMRGSDGVARVMTVLENGEVWSSYSREEEIGQVHGSASIEGQALTFKLMDVNFVSRYINEVSFTGAVTPQVSLQLKSGERITHDMTYDVTYDEPAQVEALAGQYAGVAHSYTYKSSPADSGVETADSSKSTDGIRTSFTFSDDESTVEISDKGEINLTSERNCSASGTISPRATGKNVLDVALVLKGSACSLADGANLKGIASYDADGGQVRIQTMNESKDQGLSFTATKTK